MMCACSECAGRGQTYSEEFRAQCEARAVAGLVDDAARSEYLALVRQNRGEESARAMREGAWRLLRA